jgi:hypothetical protein
MDREGWQGSGHLEIGESDSGRAGGRDNGAYEIEKQQELDREDNTETIWKSRALTRFSGVKH